MKALEELQDHAQVPCQGGENVCTVQIPMEAFWKNLEWLYATHCRPRSVSITGRKYDQLLVNRVMQKESVYGSSGFTEGTWNYKKENDHGTWESRKLGVFREVSVREFRDMPKAVK